MDLVSVAHKICPGLHWIDSETPEWPPERYAAATVPLDESQTPTAGALALFHDRGFFSWSLTVCSDRSENELAKMAHLAVKGSTDPARGFQDLVELCHGIGCVPDLAERLGVYYTGRGDLNGSKRNGHDARGGDPVVSPSPVDVADEDPKE